MPQHQTTFESLDSDRDRPDTAASRPSGPTNPETPSSSPTEDSDNSGALKSADDQDTPESPATDTTQPPENIDEDEITTLNAQETVDEWTTAHEAAGDHYTYLHVHVDVYRTLTNMWWGLRITTREKLIDNPRNSYGGYVGCKSPDPQDLVDTIIDWVSGTLATPYLPLDEHDLPVGHHIRAVPSERIPVFVSEAAADFLTDRDIPVDALQDVTAELQEHTPTDEYYEQVVDYYGAGETIDNAKERIRDLEMAVGAAFDISTGCGTTPPDDPPAEYASLSPNDLQAELAAARETLAAAERRRDNLKDELAAKQDAWADKITDDLHARLAASTSTSGSIEAPTEPHGS